MKKQDNKDIINNFTYNDKKQNQPRVNMLLPPPLLLVILGILAASLHWIKWGGFQLNLTRILIGGSVIVLGCLLIYLSGKAFLKEKTPIRPDRTHTMTIVMHGPYAFSRNPMYLGMALILVGLSFALKSPFLLFATFIFIIILQLGVIRREERYLLQMYPEIYRAYIKKVRRWF